MKIKKSHISGYRKLLISIACLLVILVISFFIRRNLQPLSEIPASPQETQTPKTHHKPRKNKAPKPSSAEPVRKKRNTRNNTKRPVSASRRKKAEQEAAQRRADLECLLYEDSLN